MTPQLWIGLGFTAALVVFLMITFFVKDTSSATQYKTLRFLTALCAGFAGGFLTGEALFHLDQQIGGGTKLVISGTAGCALFFAVWFTYGPRSEPPPPDRIVLSIPEGWTFEQAARGIVEVARGIVTFDGFQPLQLATKLPTTNIDAPTVVSALTQLRYQSTGLPAYSVVVEDGVFHLRVNA
jgi:hypothetical protein